MKRHSHRAFAVRNSAVAALAAIIACSSACNPTPKAGPDAPFSSPAHPRNPDHFILGNGSNLPTPYADVRSQAVASGQTGMSGFEFQDWLRPTGQIDVTPEGNSTRYHFTLAGLVPGGFYTAWLVRVRASTRGPKTDLPMGEAFEGLAAPRPGSNAVPAAMDGTASHDISLDPLYTDGAGVTYFGIDAWDEVHVAFHADNRGWGFAPGPNHWTQVVFPIRPHDGSAMVALAPLAPTSFSTGNGVDPATTFDEVKATALMSGQSGGKDYSEMDWRAARGRVTWNTADYATSTVINVMVTAEGLIPRGAYSAWLVTASGKSCPLGEINDGPAPASRALVSAQLDVDASGRGAMEATLTPTSSCGAGTTFNRLSDWARVEVVFHADGRFHGLTQGTSHWAQLQVPVPDLP